MWRFRHRFALILFVLPLHFLFDGAFGENLVRAILARPELPARVRIDVGAAA
jgi:hypothetical protein